MSRAAAIIGLGFLVGGLVAAAGRASEYLPGPPGRVGGLYAVPADIYSAAGVAPAPAGDAAAADAVFSAARAAVAAGAISDAFRLAVAALEIDPDHADARRLLGYQRIGEHWAGGYAQRMLGSGHVWSAQYGWVKADHLPRYEQGERPSRGRWVSAEVDARQHESIDRGWAVRTDHVLVITNVDRAAGVELAVRLESLYQIWRQLFGELAATREELQARLDGKEAGEFVRKPFRVLYHRNRQEYNDALRRRQGQIEMTLGIYFDQQRESHFFAGDEQDPGTVAHEAVHQFFYESTPRAARRLAVTANAWAVEAAACYFESLASVGPRVYALGAADAGRLQAARHRRVVDDFYVPLAELSALGMTDLQQRSDLPRIYSQSAGLASFLIDGADGRYRGAFRELLAAIYAGRDNQDTLAELTGRTYQELDREYLQYMQDLPAVAVLAEP